MMFGSLHHYPGSSRPPRRVDARLESPGQLALIGLALWLVGALIHPLGVLAPLGLILVVAAGLAYLLRPRAHTMYWRGRELDLGDKPGPIQQLYRLMFKR